MITQSREEVCRKIVKDKQLLALTFAQVMAIDTYLKEEWGIKLPSDPKKFEKELIKAAGGKLRKDYNTLNNKQAEYLISGEPVPPALEQKFYDLIADEKIAGLIHSKKRTFILDAAALIISLIKNLHVSGPILDIGCSIGYHCGVVGKFAGLEIVGIDSSKITISEANRRNKTTAGTTFKATTIENEEFEEKFDLVYAIDSIEINKANLHLISRTLKPNGIALLIDDLQAFTSAEFKKALTIENLGFGFADVTGGWIGEETGFEGKTVLVLIKGGTQPLPSDLQQQAESYWDNHFKDYANDKTNREDRKSQAYCRAKLANLPALAASPKLSTLNLKKEITESFLKCGIDSSMDTYAVELHLKSLMGNKRYTEYLKVTEAVHEGEIPIKYTYNCANTLKEANTLITHQGEVFVDVSTHIYTALKPLLKESIIVGDLGCYTGVFINWLASKHPECNFLGFDSEPKIVGFAKEQNPLPNTKIHQWDYTAPSRYRFPYCDILVSSFGLDFNTRETRLYSLDADDLRNCPGYKYNTNEAYYFFHCWREAIKPGGKLIVVLRIGYFDRLIGILDAAVDAGWNFDSTNSKRISSGSQGFPMLIFNAENPVQLSQKTMIEWWLREYETPQSFEPHCVGCTALTRYQSLPNKIVIKENAETFPDGHTMTNIIGRSDDIAYSYSRATTGLVELKTVPIAKIETLSFNY